MLYGGAAGGGKTDALLIHAWNVATTHRNARVLFLRRTYADLRKGGAAIDRSHELYSGHALWNGGHHRWTFPNGSIVEFGHLQHGDSVYNYQGAQYDALIWDELTQFEEAQYTYLVSRVRSRIGARPSIRAATNPGGVGHGWVKTQFVDSAPAEVPFVLTDDVGQPLGTARFIPAKLSDNQALLSADPTYEQRLGRLPDALRRALRDGDWDVFEGQVFTEWRRETHVLPPFAVPPTWPRKTGLDYGTNRPFVCLWLATGPRLETDPPANAPCSGQHVYVYRELTGRGWHDEQMAKAVATLSQGERIATHNADPASFFLKNNQTGQSPAALFASHGVRLAPANNDRIPGKRAVEYQLARCACGVPRLRVFSTCAELIRAIPSLPYDQHNVEDVDTSAEGDDPYDALRYALMGPRPAKAGTVNVYGLTASGAQHG